MAVSHACSAVTTWIRSGSGAAAIVPATNSMCGHSNRAARAAPAVTSSGRFSIDTTRAAVARSRVTYIRNPR